MPIKISICGYFPHKRALQPKSQDPLIKTFFYWQNSDLLKLSCKIKTFNINAGSSYDFTLESYCSILYCKRYSVNVDFIATIEYRSETVYATVGSITDDIVITKSVNSKKVTITNNQSSAIACIIIG